MTNDDTMNTRLCRAYRLAILLTGEIHSSESVTLTAIETLPDDTFSEVALLSEVARTAWQRSRLADVVNRQRCDIVLPALPKELQRVSDLPKTLRYCFAMRILIGLTAQACGQAIGLQPEQVDYFVRQATQILARTRLPSDWCHPLSFIPRRSYHDDSVLPVSASGDRSRAHQNSALEWKFPLAWLSL